MFDIFSKDGIQKPVPAAGVNPIRVEPLESIPESLLQRRREVDGRELELDPGRAWRQNDDTAVVDVPGPLVRTAAQQHPLEAAK